MNSYNFNGDLYKKSSIYQKEWGKNLINSIDSKSNYNILDLGCGDGVLTYELATLVPDGYVIGIDSSYGMLLTASKYKRDNLYFKRMDINHLDFDIKFDIIYSNAALHWIENHRKILIDCHTLLTDTGKIHFNFASHGTCINFNRIAKDLTMDSTFKNYFKDFNWPWHMHTIDDYRKLITDLNLYSNIDINLEIADKNFLTKEAFVNWICQPCLVPFLQILPDDLKDIFKERLINQMLSHCVQGDNTYFETFRRINIIASK